MHSKIETEKTLALENILYIESFNKTLVVHTVDGGENKTKGRIGDIAQSLEQFNFIRIHKSYIVNAKYILKLKNYMVFLNNDIILNASQRRWKYIKELYFNYIENVCER